ncbi:formate dehydrogenase, nitrate-inducible,iron-sulfur subunit [Salmonella bongori]|nr:formate dehydrogenase, nitrate-inducible,iron-sulfur subunit [Salmonella bongori]
MYTLRRPRQWWARNPACVKTCPTGAIHFGTKKEMLELGEQRVKKLKARGFEHAGIYNPDGVGGTHVMYVLHHANQPELYHGLPKDPQIDTSINLWKGALKPAGCRRIYRDLRWTHFPLHRYWSEQGS